ERNGIASTAFALLTAASAVGLVLVGVAAWQLPHIFPGMPVQLHREARIALMLMGGSFAVGLPISVVHATFIGLQRNELPMAIMLINRSVMAGRAVLAALQHRGLSAMAAGGAPANCPSYTAPYVA